MKGIIPYRMHGLPLEPDRAMAVSGAGGQTLTLLSKCLVQYFLPLSLYTNQEMCCGMGMESDDVSFICV